MKKLIHLAIALLIIPAAFGQATLPSLSVNNFSDKVIISWKNAYTLPVATISIQRSYDSLRNYSTIGTVLNPQNTENGYTDVKPPYMRMYYRVFVAFEDGSYLITPPSRPGSVSKEEMAYDWQAVPAPVDPANDPAYNPVVPPPPGKKVETWTPSTKIFTSQDSHVIINLRDAATEKYTVKFFRMDGSFLFEIAHVPDEMIILEKVNFIRAGWYNFEIYRNGLIVEKNRVLVPQDNKINNDSPRRR